MAPLALNFGPTMLLQVLLLAAEPRQGDDLGEALAPCGARIQRHDPPVTPWEVLHQASFDVVVVDERRAAEGPRAFVETLRQLPEPPEVIVLSEDDSAEHRAEILSAQAFAVLNPGVGGSELVSTLSALLERIARGAHAELIAEGLAEAQSLGQLVARSAAMREFLGLVRRVADSDSTLLVTGETGVGKEVLSRAIHAASERAGAPFVAVNCSALSESLLESELFGHVEGAFTGALRARRGYFELAHTGTLFLDEIGELTPQLQVKLLRVLQDRRIQPVGSEEEIEIDVRLVAATNRDLVEETEAGRFRSDLYFRLSVVALEVPPLRDRHEDIPDLVQEQLDHLRRQLRRPVHSISGAAMDLLLRYPWPGNIRELSNMIERAVLLCEGDTIEPIDLPEEVRLGRPRFDFERDPAELTPVLPGDSALRSYRDARTALLRDFERRFLRSVLTRCNGRVGDAAKLAELNPRTLYELMSRHGMRKEDFRLDR